MGTQVKQNRKYALLLFSIFISCALHSQIIHVDSLTGKAIEELNFEVIDTLHTEDTITVILTVRHKNGSFVTGLAPTKTEKKYFSKVFDTKGTADTANYTVIEISEENFLTKAPPMNFAIVLDYSGSMDSYYIQLQRSAQNFIEALRGHYFTRVNFDEDIVIVNDTPTKSPIPVTSDPYYAYRGGTALLRGVYSGIHTLKDARGIKNLIVFSDGLENSSYLYPQTVLDDAINYKTRIHSISFDPGGAPLLKELSKLSNGEFYPIEHIDELTSKFSAIRDQFTNQYIIKLIKEEEALPVRIAAKINNITKEIPIKPRFSSAEMSTTPSFYFGTLLFKFDMDVLIPSHKNRIQFIAPKIIQYLIDNPNSRVILDGHASPEGTSLHNMKLSEKRAKKVYEELVKVIKNMYKGDEEKEYEALRALSRIDYYYYGSERNIYKVDSPKNDRNRRVEIKVQAD